MTREAHGLYRDPTFPVSPHLDYMAATLWPTDVRGTISHESALALFDLSDANPATIHLTVPRRHRVRRVIPPHYTIHQADLPAAEITRVEGIPVTTAARAIRDCHATHLGPALLRQAISDGRRAGYLTQPEADDLATEVLTPAHTTLPLLDSRRTR